MTYTEIITALISIVALFISITAAYYSRRQAKAAELQAIAAFSPIENEMHIKMDEFLSELADHPISALARSEKFFQHEMKPINSGVTSIGKVIEEGGVRIRGFQEEYFELQSTIEREQVLDQGPYLQHRLKLLEEAKKYSVTLKNKMNDARKISASRK